MTESSAALRAGVIGCDFFAQNHLHAWRHTPRVELTSVCDFDPNRAREAAEEFKVESRIGDERQLTAALRGHRHHPSKAPRARCSRVPTSTSRS